MKRIVTGRGIAGAVCLEEGPRKKTEGRAKRFFDLDFSFCSFFGLSTFETFSRLFPLPDDLFLFCFVMQSNTLGIHGVYGVSKSHVMQGKCKMQFDKYCQRYLFNTFYYYKIMESALLFLPPIPQRLQVSEFFMFHQIILIYIFLLSIQFEILIFLIIFQFFSVFIVHITFEINSTLC